MNQHEQERFDGLYSKHLQALKLQGKREKTIDGYARALRRIACYFDCCPDSLNPEQLKSYFAWMVESYSWSSVKVDLWGLSFFYRHVLGRKMEWIEIINPPKARSLPDVPTREEVQRLINGVYRLRYRVFFVSVQGGVGQLLAIVALDSPLKRALISARDSLRCPVPLLVSPIETGRRRRQRSKPW
jgi:integrase